MIMGIPNHYFNGYLNCYVGSNYHDKEEDGNRIYVVFRSDDLAKKSYRSKKGIVNNSYRINVIKTHKQFVKEIGVNDFILYVFRPLPNFEKDLEVFKTGKYSKFSMRYKKIITTTYPNTKKIRSIINPSKKDREEFSERFLLDYTLPEGSELFSKPEEIDEHFSIAHYLEVET
jgi:hypothetical protein